MDGGFRKMDDDVSYLMKKASIDSLCILSGEWAGTKKLAENLFSLPIFVIMELTESLSHWERWRCSRRRGRIIATITLSPAIAGALPEGEPLDACNLRVMGFALCLCNTKAKLAIKTERNQNEIIIVFFE